MKSSTAGKRASKAKRAHVESLSMSPHGIWLHARGKDRLARSARAAVLAFALATCAIGVLFACGSSTPAANTQDPGAASECVDAGHYCVPYDGYHSASGCNQIDPTLKCADESLWQCCLDVPPTCACDDGGPGCACPPCQEQFGDAAAGCNAPGQRLFVCTDVSIPVDAGECNCGASDNRGTLCCCEAVVVGDE